MDSVANVDNVGLFAVEDDLGANLLPQPTDPFGRTSALVLLFEGCDGLHRECMNNDGGK